MNQTPAPQRRIASEALVEATGKDWDEWFSILDDWGAASHNHGAIARYLVEEQRVDGWWAQSITVGFEQERGLRAPGQRPDGTFDANAAKTIDVSADIVFDFFADEERRSQWLLDDVLALRTATRPKSLRFDFGSDGSRLLVGLVPKSEHKVAVQVTHEKLPDAQTLVARKAYWKEHLATLKKVAEVYRPM